MKIGSLTFFLSCIYGDPVRARRNLVWDRITSIGASRDEAWILVGDFNELLNANEKVGGPIREESTFWDFRNMVDNCRIKEIRSSGNWLSWAGWRDRIWVQCRLDRSFGNDEWYHIFPRAHMEYCDMRASDHRPILISFVREERVTGRGRFVFDKRMLSQAGVADIVKFGWGEDQSEVTTPLVERIRRCRLELSKWNRIMKMGS